MTEKIPHVFTCPLCEDEFSIALDGDELEYLSGIVEKEKVFSSIKCDRCNQK